MGACSASNGDAVPPEVREAGVLEAGTGTTFPDGSRVDDTGAKKDSGRDAGKDVGMDAAPSEEILINEIHVDIDGFGDGVEYVELRAAPGTLVGGLLLRVLDKTGGVKTIVAVADVGETVGPTGFWVVGGAQTFRLGVSDRVDQVVPLANWGLDTDRGAVQLMRGSTLLDVVGWSETADAGAIPAPTAPPTATGEGSPSRVPTIAKHSFGRRSDAADTNDNAADFCSMAASPGFAQKVCD